MPSHTNRSASGSEPSIVDRVLVLLRAYLPSFEMNFGRVESPPAGARPSDHRRRPSHQRPTRPERNGPGRRYGGSAKGSGSTRRAGAGGGERRGQGRTEGTGVDPVLMRSYAELEVAYGADLQTVRSAWRRLVRKHHPDRHALCSETARATSERIRSVNRAYCELLHCLRRGA